MGGYYGLVVLVGVALLLSTGQCDVSCGGQDGRPGEAGVRGRDGRPGPKGVKGEPAAMAAGPVDPGVLLKLKGELGSRGLHGIMGHKGFSGDLGLMGIPGLPGLPGPDGMGFNEDVRAAQLTHSAFSVVRSINTYPAYNQRITFQTTIINKPADFNTDTGEFTCRVSGVYYFVFHSMSKVSMCLRLASDALGDRKLGFCDYNTRNNNQVLSGGVVLQLAAGQKVWLESFKDEQPDSVRGNTEDKKIIFNGFMIF